MRLPTEPGVLAAPLHPLDPPVPQDQRGEEAGGEEQPLGTRHDASADSHERMVRLESLLNDGCAFTNDSGVIFSLLTVSGRSVCRLSTV